MNYINERTDGIREDKAIQSYSKYLLHCKNCFRFWEYSGGQTKSLPLGNNFCGEEKQYIKYVCIM